VGGTIRVGARAGVRNRVSGEAVALHVGELEEAVGDIGEI